MGTTSPSVSLPSRSCCMSCRPKWPCSMARWWPAMPTRPNFARLHVRWTRPLTIHLWAFDLLAFNGRDLRLQPLVKRQSVLQGLLERFGCPAVSLSEAFEDGLALLRVAEERGLEGIVSKRRDSPYRSGDCRDWRKVKTAAWREANRERWRLFELQLRLSCACAGGAA